MLESITLLRYIYCIFLIHANIYLVGFTNSLMACLYISQGKELSVSNPLGSSPSFPPHTAIAVNFFSPSETALNIAVLSPHLQAP